MPGLMNQHHILNKVSLSKHTHETRLCIGQGRRGLEALSAHLCDSSRTEIRDPLTQSCRWLDGVHWKDWCWSSNTLKYAKSWLIRKGPDPGKDWGQEEKGMTEDEKVGWHHRLDGREFEWTPGVGDGQGGLVCCGSWGHKESDTTEWLNWYWCSLYQRNWKTKREELGEFPGSSVVRTQAFTVGA